MIMTVIVILVVSGALLLGAAWGIYGRLPERFEGGLIALAAGALMLSAVLELIVPALNEISIWAVLSSVLFGAAIFAGLDYLVDEKWGGDSGGGLLAAITLDGIPENLALGVALISSGPLQVIALSASIFLSNLPEAASGAKQMAAAGHSNRSVFILWVVTALTLSAAALVGNVLLAGAPDWSLSVIKCFAGGAVVSSLATELFPQAYREDAHWAGMNTAIGFMLALYLHQLA